MVEVTSSQANGRAWPFSTSMCNNCRTPFPGKMTEYWDRMPCKPMSVHSDILFNWSIYDFKVPQKQIFLRENQSYHGHRSLPELEVTSSRDSTKAISKAKGWAWFWVSQFWKERASLADDDSEVVTDCLRFLELRILAGLTLRTFWWYFNMSGSSSKMWGTNHCLTMNGIFL